MSRSLKRRIFCSLVCGGVYFNLLFFIGLLSRNEDWRIYAIIWSISLTIGWIVSAIIEEKIANENKIIFFKLVILFTVILIILFVTRVILSLSNWDYIVLNISIPFTFAIWLTKWKK